MPDHKGKRLQIEYAPRGQWSPPFCTLEAVMYFRTFYLTCFGYRRAMTDGQTFSEWGFIRPREYFSSAAAATRVASRR